MPSAGGRSIGTDLRVTRVQLHGTELPHVWEFPLGVTVIVGDVGGGKTSLLNLIEYGLGGTPALTAEVREAADGVSLAVEAGTRRLELSRRFGDNAVRVLESDGDAQTFATRSGARHPWLSNLLLEALGIPRVRVRRSRTGRSHALTSISFLDVFAYCYLDQDQVDRSTVHDDDRFLGPKRLATFELLHGLLSERLAALEAELEELRDQSVTRRKRIESVEQFAAEKRLDLSRSNERLRALAVSERDLSDALARTHRQAEEAAATAQEGRQNTERVERELQLARSAQRRLAAELDGVRRAANQLERDIAVQQAGLVVRERLDRLPFLICPRCEQPLDARPAPEGHCVVCLQPDPERRQEADEAELIRLQGQLSETRLLAQQLAAAEAAAQDQVTRRTAELAEREREIREAVEQATSPHRSQAAQLQEQLGAVRGERRALAEIQRVGRVVEQERHELQELGPAMGSLEEQADAERNRLAQARTRVDELSEAFGEILSLFTLPWLESAEVDRESYLPRVNGRSLRELSSGGMKATTNVAYYMSILVTAMRDREVLTPRFLMLDSIRKDYGGGEKDLARAERIYDYLRTLQDMRRTPGALASDFQLIVVDNDLPRTVERTFNTIRIDPDRPLIRTGR